VQESANQPQVSLRPEPMKHLHEKMEESICVEADQERKLRTFYTEKVPQFVQTQICQEDQAAYGKP
jgi:hypothetical protein